MGGDVPEAWVGLSIRRRAVRGAPWVAAAAWINRIALAVVLVVLARELSARQLGLLAVVLLLSNLMMILNDLGFGFALIYQQTNVREAAETVFFLCLVWGMAMAFGLFVAAPTLSRFFDVPEAVPIMRAYALLVALDAWVAAPMSLLSRNLEFSRRFVLEGLPALFGGALTIGLALHGTGVWSVPIGDGLRYGLAAALAIAVLRVRFWPRWHGRVAGELWRYARGAIVASLLDFVLVNIDYALVARLLGPVQLGYYSLAFRIAILPFYLITMVVVGVAWPSFARAMPDLGRVRRGFRSSVRLASAGVSLVAGGLIALAPWLQVLGARWAPAVMPARLLGLYVCLRTAAYLLGALFQGVGRPGLNAVLRGIWVILLATLIGTVGRLGITAVAAVQVCVAVVLLVAHFVVGRRIVEIDGAGFLDDLARPAVAAGIASVAVTGVYIMVGGWLADPHSWLALGVLSVTFIGVYGPILFLLSPTLVSDVRGLRLRAAPGSAGQHR